MLSGDDGLSPAHWDAAERKRFFELDRTWGLPKSLARGSKGMVVGTSGTFAVRAGQEALRKGGSAMDAALTTALAQITLHAGCVTSYAGIFAMVAYEASTGKLYALDAGYDAPSQETEPLSIPGITPSGRTALVPGFMAGVEWAHRLGGKLPFASLFDPAIYVAEEGTEVGGVLAAWIAMRKDVLGRRPDTRAVFTKPEGAFYKLGDRFRQPELAKTLRAVAEQGSAYMYAGPWAQAFVQAVQAEGGKISLKDMNHYSPHWSNPLHTTYAGNEVYTTGQGGVEMIGALNLLDLARLKQYGHYSKSPEALYWLIQIARVASIARAVDPNRLDTLYRPLSFKNPARITKEHARTLWSKMRDPEWNRKFQSLTAPGGSHSEGVLASDLHGNLVAICHSINTVVWGTTGIFVGGISIPDSAKFQQIRLAQTGPGGRVPNEMNPLIALKNRKPSLACSAVGSGLHEASLQCVHSVLEFGMNPKAAVESPLFHPPKWGTLAQNVVHNEFSKEVLEGVRKRGQPIAEVSIDEANADQGFWIGMTIDSAGERKGGVCKEFNGYALAE